MKKYFCKTVLANFLFNKSKMHTEPWHPVEDINYHEQYILSNIYIFENINLYY